METDSTIKNELEDVVADKKAKSAKSAKSGSTKSKVKTLQLARTVSDVLNGLAPERRFPKFPAKFHVISNNTKNPVLLEEFDNQVLSKIEKERIILELVKYMKTCELYEVDLHPREFKDLVNYWITDTEEFKHEIAYVRQKSEPGYCWRRLDFDFEEMDCPRWDEMLGRVSNNQALMTWIGSLFDPKARRQQYVWMVGKGGDGKGSLLRALARIFGEAAITEDSPAAENNRFWTSSMPGKRLVMFGDCNNYGFPMTGMFKSLTGGDATRVEAKHGKVKSQLLDCMFMFASNSKPQVEAKTADMRRAILCEFKPVVNTFGPDYEDRLWAEIPGLLKACSMLYANFKLKNIIEIESDKTELENIGNFSELKFEGIFETYFEARKLSMVKGGDKSLIYVSATVMYKILTREGIRNTHEHGRFKDWLEANHEVKYERIRLNGKQVRVYLGLKTLVAPKSLDYLEAPKQYWDRD